MELSKLLTDFPFISEFEVIEHKRWSNGRYIKLKLQFINQSVLYVREYADAKERNYSYHWQHHDGSLITRWDNAPHHKKISTFPHHMHVGANVTASNQLTLPEILDYIGERIRI